MGAGDKTGGTNMGKYLVKRILQMIPVMIIITMIIFILQIGRASCRERV